jgi:predicted RND superfamily exporter protein
MTTTHRSLVNWVTRAIVVLDLAILLALAVDFRQVRIVNNAIDIWFDHADPTLTTLNQERRLFGTDTWMLATVWIRPDTREDVAQAVRRLTKALERVPHVNRVISPSNVQVLQKNEQGLFFDGLDADTEWSALRNRLLGHPIAGNFLVYDRSQRMFSLLIKEHTGLSTAGAERQQLVGDVRRILDRDPDVFASAVAGSAVINADLNRLSWGDFIVLMPATFVVASLVLLAMIRFRIRTALAILTPVGVASVAVVAAMLLSGKPLTMMTIALPGLIFTLGLASSLHVTGWIANWLREGNGTAAEAEQAATRHLFRPMLVSQLTTALGFAVLAVVQVTPVQEMALFGAAGVVVSALHVLFLLPKCLLKFGGMAELDGSKPLFAGSDWGGARLEALVESLKRIRRVHHYTALLAVTCVAVVWLLAHVQFDSTYLNMIDGRERLRRDYARFNEAGLPSAELSILIRRTDHPNAVDARLNAAIRVATSQIESLPGVSKVLGPAAVFAEVAPALAGEEPLARFAAEDAAVTDSYIFALSGNTDVTNYVRDGLDAYRLSVFFPYVENSKLEQLSHRISTILDTQFQSMPNVTTGVSGVTVLWANMDNTISRGQMTSILFMASICFVSFVVSLRDWRLAACSTFVNVLPVGMVGAFLGAIGRPIDMATVFIMGIALGIADDDTSFFVHECLEREKQGEGGLTKTLRHTGPATVATCIVIVIGFGMLLLSSFTPMRTFGGMTAMGLALAMLCDIFLLPFLLVVFRRERRERLAVAVPDAIVIQAGGDAASS